MKYIADLHIHSPFSRATSKESNLPGLAAWARIKGINVIGTGDFTHPGWFGQIKETLEPAEPGFFRLKKDILPQPLGETTPEAIEVRFVLTAEISSIYKRHDKVRKVHNVLFAPDFQSAERINATLAGIGNIVSDGRPILGLDSRDLLEIQLEHAPDGFLVPAHIWTPWFSLFGSKSGFDTIEDCFGDLTEHIFALETGLSSDPDMNRMVSALDRFSLISNSDCHSPSKLGREANMFDTGFDFYSMRESLKNPEKGFLGTIEFFPEEGKYHLDGHRKCGVCLEPLETRSIKSICPVCNRPLTVGVSHRVMELADREKPLYNENTPGFKSLIPLPEVLGEIIGTGPATKGVLTQYAKMISLFGSEFNIILNTPLEDLANRFSPVLSEAVARIRRGKVTRKGGYDGEFGVITVFEEGELDALSGQISLFAKRKRKTKKQSTPKKLPLDKPLKKTEAITVSATNPEQESAINANEKHILVTAGPGTGKTFTLIKRIARLIKDEKSLPEKIIAITFTNRAADEVRERLAKETGPDAEKVFVGTFHAFCLQWLRKRSPEIVVVGDSGRDLIIKKLFPEWPRTRRKAFQNELADYFHGLGLSSQRTGSPSAEISAYINEITKEQVLDLDAVVPEFINRLSADPQLRAEVTGATEHLFVDEFQDVNRAQFDLVILFSETNNIFAIGDPDQAIYGFRGSDLNFFFDFANLPTTKTIALTRNYRSLPEILEAATGVIANNRKKGDAKLDPELPGKGIIEYHQAPTTKAEAEFVVKSIEEAMGGISHFSLESGRGGGQNHAGLGFSDIAVLYRLSSQAADICEALERRGIPFQLVGVEPFFKKKGLRHAYSFIIIAAGLGEIADYVDLARDSAGIGAASLKLLETIPANCPDFWSMSERLDIPVQTHAILAKTKAALHQFKEKSPRNLADALASAFEFLGIKTRTEEAKRLLDLATAFGNNLAAFAHHLKENATATVYDDRAEAVALMTLHGAKGLEFPLVFITGAEEGLVPYSHPMRPSDIEEERRLFYVGATRAKERLVLSSSTTRYVFGKVEMRSVSRFINEIPKALITLIAPGKKYKKKSEKQQMKLF